MEDNKNIFEISYNIEFLCDLDDICVHIIRKKGTDLNKLSSSKYLYKQLEKILSRSYFVESEPIQIRKEVTLNGEYYDLDEWEVQAKKNPIEIRIVD